MQPCVKKYIPEKEFYIDEGCYITELSNSNEDSSVSIARARVEPGVTTQFHKLIGTIERYVVLEGEGLVEVSGVLPQTVTECDVVVIPPNCGQKITSTGARDLIFLAICSPRFQKHCYQEIL
jgi:mannose-6-phosphate isomerase-like protein (cupin superfamily)